MTDIVQEVTEEVNEAPAPETKEEAWDRMVTKTETPITKEELRGEEPPEDVLPDRALVAPQIEEYLKGHKEPEQDPTLSEVASLRARIEELATPTPEEPTEMQTLLDKISSLEERDLQRQQDSVDKEALEAEEARFRTFKEGVVGNIRSEEDKYPGLIALSLEDNVFNTLVNMLQEGQQTSEDEVASKAEEELWGIYETLHAIKNKHSDDQEPSKAPNVPTTLTPDLTAVDEPWSLEESMKKGKKQAQAELWNRLQLNQ
jgi:hypothetical protein